MAILKMSRIYVHGLHRDRKAVLEELHKMEAVEVSEPSEDGVSFSETAKSIAQFEKYMQTAESALAVLDEHCPEKSGLLSGLFKGRRSLPLRNYHMSSAHSDETLHNAYHIISLSDSIREHMANIGQIIVKQAALEPYLALDVPMKTRETEHTFIKAGTLGGVWTDERLQGELEARGLHTAHYEILSASKVNTYVWLVFLNTQAQEAGAFLQEAGFSEPDFSLSHHEPAKKTSVLEEARQTLERQVEEYVSEIKECSKYRRDVELFHDHLCLRKDKYQVLARTGMTDYTFLIEGFVPRKHGDEIKQLLEGKYAAYVEIAEPEGAEDVPVAFSNNAFSAPVEWVTETYSMPSTTDIDPNPIMAFFYYLFFGMMFSDAGYGLLLMIACGYLGFGKRLEKHKRGNYRMFFFCGISTTFWGLLFGGFFGDVVYTVSTTFFGREVALTPIWLDPISRAMDLLIFSVALGMVQILIGLGVKFFTLCRQGKAADAVCDVGFWMVILMGLCSLAAGIGLESSMLSGVGTWVAIAGAAGLLATGGRKNKNVFGKIFGGVAGIYNITGYVSDALSYCRLMALGLATGAIAVVVNLLGSMFGGSFTGAALFVLISVFGHSLNFAMNMLGAYVHTNRLQYVEFFSKFYEGGGRKFDPFRMNTKYCCFSDENNEMEDGL